MKALHIFMILWALLGLNLTTISAQNTQYYLVLGAVGPGAELTNGANSTVGHAFIGYIAQNKIGKDSVANFMGYSSNGNMVQNLKAMFAKTGHNGLVRRTDSIYAYSKDARLFQVKITEKQLAEILEIERKWNKRAHYQLVKKDCVAFANEIAAQVLHLNTPERSWVKNLLPNKYWDKLLEMNQMQNDQLTGIVLLERHKDQQTVQFPTSTIAAVGH